MRTTAESTTGRGARDAPRAILTKLVVRGAVPFSDDSWESNPWRQARVASSRASANRALTPVHQLGDEGDPKTTKAAWVHPAAFREIPKETA